MAGSGSTPKPTVPLWLMLLPVVMVLLLLIVAGGQPDGRLHLWVLDVGQGDALLLRTPQGHTALVDGGPGATPLLNGVGAHVPFWQRELDLLVLTHPHQDHLMGFAELLGRYSVDEVVQTEFTATDGLQREWLSGLKRQGIPVHYAARGEEISFVGEPEVRLTVLSPVTSGAEDERRTSRSGNDINDTSVVLRLVYGSQSILLEGDAQKEAEAEMVRYRGAELHSRVLKVGHHGSKTSSSPAFLGAVRPQVAVISVGADNKFGHPAPETLAALQAVGAGVYRTDLNGTVEIIADKEQMWVRSER